MAREQNLTSIRESEPGRPGGWKGYQQRHVTDHRLTTSHQEPNAFVLVLPWPLQSKLALGIHGLFELLIFPKDHPDLCTNSRRSALSLSKMDRLMDLASVSKRALFPYAHEKTTEIPADLLEAHCAQCDAVISCP